MKTAVPIPDILVNRIEWMEKEFPTFEIKSNHIPFLLIAERNTPITGEEGVDDDDSWIAIPDPEVLVEFQPITHPFWLEDWDFEWPAVLKDALGGVTFAFHWKENCLAWER